MRICLVSEEFPPETGWGGIGTHTYNLSLALAEIGHEVHVVSKCVDGKDNVTSTGNLSIHRISEGSHQSTTLKSATQAALRNQGKELLRSLVEFPLRSLSRSMAVSRWLKRKGPFDIVEAPDYGAETFWCQITRVTTPIVIKLHTPLFLTQRLNSAPKEDSAVKLRKWMEKYCVTHAAKIISPSRALAEIISDELGVADIEIVPNCVDTDFFVRKEKRGKTAIRSVIYAGRLERRKGVEVLARAIPIVVSEIHDVRFALVGRDTPTGPGGESMKKWLENFFDTARIRQYIEFLGEVPRTNILKYFQEADVCVLPSLWENLPYTCLEAMACGVPVIASKIGGFLEIISDRIDGLLFEPGNHQQLATNIIGILRSGSINQFGARAREKVEFFFSHKVVAERAVECYERVIRSRR
jgi:glycogen(starch) synthase